MNFLLFLWVLLPGLSAVASARGFTRPRGHSRSFSLAVAEKAGHKRDFVRDWIAAHQKWGGGVPDDVVSTFSLGDSRKSDLAPPTILQVLWSCLSIECELLTQTMLLLRRGSNQRGAAW